MRCALVLVAISLGALAGCDDGSGSLHRATQTPTEGCGGCEELALTCLAGVTPVATPANLMVMGPGGYQFGDYARLGLPLMLWFILVATLLVPVIWPF